MYPNYTPEQLAALYDVPSLNNCDLVIAALQQSITMPISWIGPLDDAEFISEIAVGEDRNSPNIVITFSEHGNLCHVAVLKQSPIPLPVLEPILESYGWILVPDSLKNMIIFPETNAGLYDCFFNYA